MSSKLYFLKLLKRSGLSIEDLQYLYITVIRPISKYACTVWNHNLTSALSNQLESYQKTALRIIYGDLIKEMPYQNTLFGLICSRRPSNQTQPVLFQETTVH